MSRTITIYFALLAFFGAGIFTVIHQGRDLVPPRETGTSHHLAAPAKSIESDSLWAPLRENFKEPLSRLFLQVIVIMIATRLLGALFARFGQPAVVGEVLAGILLGPSLFGWLWPSLQSFIFPRESLGILKLLS